MADKKYSAQIELQDKFTKTMQKAIDQTTQFLKQLDKVDKQLKQLEKPRNVTIKFKLDSSFNSVKNTINRAMPKNMRINISANQDVTRAMDQANRDIFTMTNKMDRTINGMITRLANGTSASIRRANSSITSGLNSSLSSSVNATGRIIGNSLSGSIGSSLTGSLSGTLAGNMIAKSRSIVPIPTRTRTNTNNQNNQSNNSPNTGNIISRIRSMTIRIKDSVSSMYSTVSGYCSRAVNAAANGILAILSHVPGRVGNVANAIRVQMALLNQTFTQWSKGMIIPIKVRNFATSAINKIKSGISTLTTKAHNIMLTVKNSTAGRAISAITSKIKSVAGKVWSIAMKVKDVVSPVVKKIGSALKSVGGKVWNITLKGVDKVSSLIKSISGKIAALTKAAGAVVIGGTIASIKGAGDLEGQTVAMQHFIERNNNLSDGSEQGSKMTKDYIANLTKFANATPFETGDIISTGQRGVQIANGDTKEAERLVKLSADMAALNPGKSVSDAMEALADLKLGETERMKEFGFKISADEIKGMGGADAAFSKLTANDGGIGKLYSGGASKFGNTFNGLISTVTGKFKTGLAQMGGPITEALKKPLSSVSTLLDGFNDKAPAIGQAIADSFTKAYSIIQPILQSIGNVMQNVFSKINFGQYANNMIGTFKALGDALTTVFNDPTVQTGLINIANGFVNLGTMAAPVVQQLIAAIPQIIPPIMGIVSSLMDALSPAISYIMQAFQVAIPLITDIIASGAPIIESLISGLGPIFTAIGSAILAVMEAATVAWPTISSVIQVAADIISPILSTIGSLAQIIVDIFSVAWPPIVAVVNAVWSGLQPIFDMISGALQSIADFASSVCSWFDDLLGKAPSAKQAADETNYGGANVDSSNAVGLDYVPRDGYISRLHQGEMILTTQEANMYRNQNQRDYLAARRLSSIRNSSSSESNNIISPTINVYGVNDPEQLADRIVPVLTRRLGAKSANIVPV